MQGTVDRLGRLDLDAASFTELGGGVIVGTARWAAADAPRERWVVLGTNGHEITDMETSPSRRKALRSAARRRSAGAGGRS